MKNEFSCYRSEKTIVDEIHKPARINFKRRRVIIKGLNDLSHADLVDMMQEYAREKRNFKYILVVIHCFSKYVWTFPLKMKTGEDVTKGMENVLKKTSSPKNLQTDAGLEFFNKYFQGLTTKHKINHYYAYSEKKASINERVNRTLKIMMWEGFSLQGHYK